MTTANKLTWKQIYHILIAIDAIKKGQSMLTINKLNARNNKLMVRDIIDIRRMRSTGHSTAYIAEEYGVTQRTIQRVLTGEIWSSVPTDKPLKGYGKQYELTADGRIWSNTKGNYIAVTKGIVRLTRSGKKITLDVADLIKSHF